MGWAFLMQYGTVTIPEMECKYSKLCDTQKYAGFVKRVRNGFFYIARKSFCLMASSPNSKKPNINSKGERIEVLFWQNHTV